MAPVDRKNSSATKMALKLPKLKEKKPKNKEVQWEVDSIIGHGKRYGTLHYLVQWKGDWKPTFEPVKNLDCDDALMNYHSAIGRDPRKDVQGTK